MFHVTGVQLTKAVTGINYESGLHSSAKKRKASDVDATIQSKVAKTATGAAPSTSKSRDPAIDKVVTTSKQTQEEDTLTSSSDSESLPDVPFKC